MQYDDHDDVGMFTGGSSKGWEIPSWTSLAADAAAASRKSGLSVLKSLGKLSGLRTLAWHAFDVPEWEAIGKSVSGLTSLAVLQQSDEPGDPSRSPSVEADCVLGLSKLPKLKSLVLGLPSCQLSQHEARSL